MRKCLIVLLLIGVILVGNGCGIHSHYRSDFITDVNSNDYGLELEDITVEVAGLKGEYHFLYMTDNQANFDDRYDLGWFGNTDSRCYRDANGVSSADNFGNWIQYANDSRVDAMLLGGDSIDFGSEKNYEVLSTHLEGLKMPYIYTYGNHDSYIPWEDRFDDENPEFLQFFKDGSSEFQAIDIGELYIVSIRNYQIDGIAQVSETVLEGFKNIVEEDKPIVLICHVPVCTEMTESLKTMAQAHQGQLVVQYDAGEFGIVNKSVLMGEGCGYELTQETKQFLEILTSEESSVIMVLSGHLHESWQGYINEEIYQYVGNGAFTNKGAIIHITGENTRE